MEEAGILEKISCSGFCYPALNQVGYPSRDEERRIVNATTQASHEEIRPILSGRDLLWIPAARAGEIPASDHMVDYAVDLVPGHSPQGARGAGLHQGLAGLELAGPRAAQYLILASTARAILHGRLAVSAGDIRPVLRPVLRHRIFTNFNADAEGVGADQIIDKILQAVPEPSSTVSPAVTEVPGSRLPRRPSRREPEGQAACSKVGLDRSLIPAAFVRSLFRSARVFRPLPSVDRGLQVTRRLSGTRRSAVAEDGHGQETCPNQLYKTDFSPVLNGRLVGKSR